MMFSCNETMQYYWIDKPIIVDVTEVGRNRFSNDLCYTCLSTQDHSRYVLTDDTRFLHHGKSIDRKTAETLVFSNSYKVYIVSIPNHIGLSLIHISEPTRQEARS